MLLVAAARADDHTAPAGRWGDVRGTPSGGYASDAEPVVHDPVEAFRIELPGEALHSPLIWNGLAHVVCTNGEESTLIGVDIHLGEVVAKKTLGSFRGPPAVWKGTLVYNHGGEELIAVRRSGRSFRKLWKTRKGRFGEPVFWRSRVYVVNDGQLECYQAGRASPRWRCGSDLCGRPAVYGPAVYAVGHRQQSGYPPELMLYAFDRTSGTRKAQTACGFYAKDSSSAPIPSARFTITIGAGRAFVHPPRALAARSGAYALASIDHAVRDGTVVFSNARLVDYETTPSVHRYGHVAARSDKGAIVWSFIVGGRVYRIADSRTHPRLLARRVPPVVLGDVVYFGHWACDIRSQEILWKLPRARVTLPVAPADGLVLLVTGKRRTTLVALRERGAE